MWNFFSFRRFNRFVCQYHTIVFIRYIDLVELRETIKTFSTGATWDWQRMNNSTRAVWALERLYSFSLSHPASGRFSSCEIYENSHREFSNISRITLSLESKLKCKFYTALLFSVKNEKHHWNLQSTKSYVLRIEINFVHWSINFI